MTELENKDVATLCNFICMDPAMFQEILRREGPRIEKFDTAKPSTLVADLPIHSASWQLVRDTEA